MTGIDPFIDPFAGGLVGILVDTAKRVGGSLAQSLSDRSKAAEAVKRYADKYTARYGEVRHLGMRQGLPLEAIYTKVRFLDELNIHTFSSVETLEKDYRSDFSRRLQNPPSATFESLPVVNENQHLLILGKPGAGKTTFLRCIGLEALRGDYGALTHDCIPVFLELKRFDVKSTNLTQMVSEELSNFGFPSSEQFALNLLEQGKLLVLLDGLDEISKASQNGAIEEIQSFVTRYDLNRYIVSCRVAAYQSALNRFRDVEIADFDNTQIQMFMRNWFQCSDGADLTTASQCWESLNNAGNAASKELSHNPLLLSFLCRSYDQERGFPKDRATLYRKALDSLLRDWAVEKRLQQDPIHQEIHSELEKELLSDIAYQGFEQDQLFFTRQELVSAIKEFLSNVVDKPRSLNSMAVLDAIAIQQGVLVERAEDIYSFSHLTLQEYLVARHISQKPELIRDIVSQHWADQRWYEVFLLLSGSLSSSDELIQLIETSSLNRIRYPKVKALLHWAESITQNSSSPCSPPAKRATAIAWVINLVCNKLSEDEFFEQFRTQKRRTVHPTLAYKLSHSFLDDVFVGAPRTIEFFCDISRIRRLEELEIFSGVDFTSLLAQISNGQTEDKFVQSVHNQWIEALHLEAEWTNLSMDEIEELAAYLYGNLLLLNCKDSSVRTSESSWKKIENRMVQYTDAIQS